MSDQIDPKELLGKVQDTDLRTQLEQVFGALEGSALRRERDDAIQRLKEAESRERLRTYKDAGIPESAYDVLDKVYDGDLDPEAVRTFAQEKGFALTGTPSTQAPTADPSAARAEGEQRLQAVANGALPIRDLSENDLIAKAQAEGDWDTFNRLNAQKLEAARRAS